MCIRDRKSSSNKGASSQAWSLAWDDAPLFEEDFEAWVGGPVCPQLFRTHQGKFVLPADYYQQYATDAFTKDQKENLESVKKERVEGYVGKALKF